MPLHFRLLRNQTHQTIAKVLLFRNTNFEWMFIKILWVVIWTKPSSIIRCAFEHVRGNFQLVHTKKRWFLGAVVGSDFTWNCVAFWFDCLHRYVFVCTVYVICFARSTHNKRNQIDLLLSSTLPYGPLIQRTIQHFFRWVGHFEICWARPNEMLFFIYQLRL